MSTIKDIIEEISCSTPEGRDLTDDEKQRISDWPLSRQEHFRLTKLHGDSLKIPKELLENVHEMALKELAPAINVLIPKKEAAKERVKFNPMGDNSDTEKGFVYLELWQEFPKREHPVEGKKAGMEAARQRIKTRAQFDLAMNVIKNYKAMLYRRYPNENERKMYTLSFNKFIETIEDYFDLTEAKSVERVKQKVQKPWTLTYRPAYPWESKPGDSPEVRQQKIEMAATFTVEKKKEIEEQIKQEVGFYDQNNEKWWYEV